MRLIFSSSLFRLAALALAVATTTARAEYHYFDDVKSGSDIVMKEVRWPYWNGGYYNTWWSQGWTDPEGVSDYWYNGLGLPPAGSPNPVGGKYVVNWSFWGFSNPINITDTISTVYTSPNTFSMPTIGEGTIFRSPGMWGLWQTNVWYRMVLRTWQPVNGTPHLGYAGTWMKDSSSGIWYHMASIQLPFSVTGTDGSSGFQEDAGGSTVPQRTDYRSSYYHYNGAWHSSTNWHGYCHGWQMNVGQIEANTAVYLETCNNSTYGGVYTNGQSSPEFNLVQPAQPSFDPIVVTNYGAALSGNQLLVQWQVPPTSSPQFAYQINVYTNAAYTGSVVASAYDIAPEVRQKLLTYTNGVLPYVQLTIIDVFSQTNAPVNITPTNATLSAAAGVSGAVNGLNYAYYQSATFYTSDSQTNWATMPNFASLTPVSQGAVAGLDLTPRQRRNGYAFNYNGYINVPASGLYAFTLNSCDGSRIYVDGQLVVSFDGKHSPVDASGWAGLQAGYHTLNVQYFFDVQPTSMFSDYFDALTLSWEGPGISKSVVPVTAFYRVPGGSEPSLTLSSPTNGTILSGASVPLSASVTANGNTINKVQFYNGNYFWAQDATAPFSLNSFFWANANNAVRARLIYNGTNAVDSAVNLVTTTNSPLVPWQYNQIFYHNQPNGASIQGGTYSVIGDGVNLLTRQVSGDCTLIAHLAGITSSAAAPDGSTANTGWQAGIILRGSTTMTPGYPWGKSGTAPFAAVFGQVDGGAYYQNETMVNGGGGYSSGNLGGQKWFKLVRSNLTNFTSYVSSDGASWTQVNSTNLTDFGTTLYAGLFTYAGPSSNPNVHWASFDSVSLIGNILGPPTVSVTPQTDTAYTGQSSTFTALPGGSAPFSFQWQLNGANIAGATTSTLTLTNLQATNSGQYGVVLTNANGSAAATATLSVLTPPPAAAQILSNAPLAYLRLNEATGPTAYDSAGNFNGTGQGSVLFGVPGVTNAPFTGFESGNLGAQFGGDSAPSDIAIAPFNVATTNFTITGWVNCNGTQDSWSGLAFSRGSGHGVGLMVVNNGGNELRYSWNDNGNDYNSGTGLIMPAGKWAFVALAISPTQAIVYFATNGTLRSWTNTTANIGQTFSGSFYLGCDPNSLLSGSRQFNGTLDEFAFYNRTLTGAQISQIFTASQAAAPPSVSLTAPSSDAILVAPATTTITASVGTNGHSISSVQFYNGVTLLGQATSAPFSCSWSNVPAGTYTLLARLVYDGSASIYSAPVVVTVNAPAASPASVTPVALAANLVTVSWPPSVNSAGYLLSRDGTLIAATAGTNFLDFGLSPGATYCYSVVATNAWGASAPSPTSCVTTPSSGAALWWDPAGSPTGPQDGSGVWGSGGAAWWNGTANVAWANSSLAVIGSGTPSNCTISITNDVTPSGLNFPLNAGGSYTLAGNGGGLNLSGAPTFTLNADAAISAVVKGSGSLVKAGPGMLTLSANNSYTGGTTVSAGILKLSSGGSSGTLQGALTINPGATVECAVANALGWSGANWVRNITINQGTLLTDVASDNGWGTTITMTAGTMATSVSGGYFAMGSSPTFNVTGASQPSVISANLTLRDAAPGGIVFNVTRGTAASDLVVSGAILNQGSGNVTKSGTGIMTLAGANTYIGTTGVNAGTLQVDGSLGTNAVAVGNSATLAGTGTVNGTTTISSGGTLAPGDGGIGRLTLTRTLTLNSGSRTVLELSKNGSLLTNDYVVVTGGLTLGGTLTVTNIGATPLAAGDSFVLFSAGSWSGSFSGKTLPALPANLGWDTTGLANSGVITVVSLPVIASQPQSVSTFVNSNATFSVTPSGTPAPACQWRFNGTNIPGATATNWTVSSAQTTNEGAYTVVLSNSGGSITSSVVSLTLFREFGRAPAPYPSLLASDGARHLVVPGFQLGATNVISTDARTNGAGEDGVQFASVMQSGQPATVLVVASAAGWLNAWVDYAANGSWTNAGDQVVANAPLVAGTNTLNFTVPTSAMVSTNIWARFRFSADMNLAPTGPSGSGEVEDYPVAIAGFTLAYAAGANGTVVGATNQTVNYGASGTAVTAAPDAGYRFASWSDGSTANPRTDANVTNNLALIAQFVVDVSTNPVNLVVAPSAGALVVSWPADHIGWQLQTQASTLTVGLGTNWGPWPGSTTTNQVAVPVDAASPAVFLRLAYPPAP
jgi:autotransporter-associated beta strand protein